MAIDAVAIGVAAGNEVRAIFRDGLETLRAGEAQYLVDGQPESISGALSQAAGRSACRVYGTGNTDLAARAAERYERACRPYLDSINQGSGAGLDTPFEGGQCDGEPYLFTIGWVTTPTGAVTSVSRTAYGPIGGPTILFDGGSYRLQYTARGARPSQSCDVLPATLLAAPETFTAISTAGERSAPFISGMTRCNGPDGCGSPPPEVRPPVGAPDPSPPPFRFNPRPGIDVNIDTSIDVDGRITFNFGVGDIVIDPFTDNPFDDGDDGAGGSGDGGTNPPPGDIGSPGSSSSTGEGGESSGEADPGQVLVGLKVEILETPDNAREYAPGTYRGVGYFYMGVPGNLDQDFGGSIIRSGQFLFAEKENLTAWMVRANVGFNLRTTPYYREVD